MMTEELWQIAAAAALSWPVVALTIYEMEKRAEMTDQFVYLIQTIEGCDAPRIVLACLTEAEAEKFVGVLNRYAAEAPQCPDLELDANGQEWAAYAKAQRMWRAKHPLGDADVGYLNQHYEVGKLRLAGKTEPRVEAQPEHEVK
jgi:hypothetical protein